MMEQINAPQGVPIDGVVHGLGGVSAAALSEAAPTEAPTPAQEAALYPGTTLSKKEYIGQYERWVDGSSTESVATDIARIAMSAGDQAILDGIDMYYTTLNTADVLSHAMYTARQLTPEEIRLVQKYAHLFMEVVQKDGQRSNMGQPSARDLVIQWGHFMPAVSDFTHGETWHVDTHQQPTVRYVASFGAAGSSQFAGGILEPHDVTSLGSMRNPHEIEGGEAWQIRQPEPGTVTRFPARFGVHRTPKSHGNRLFLSASIYPAYQPA